jgi:hypothetical protein
VEPLLNLSAQTQQSVTTNSNQSAFFCWLEDKSKQLDKDIPSQLLYTAEAENSQQMRKIIGLHDVTLKANKEFQVELKSLLFYRLH